MTVPKFFLGVVTDFNQSGSAIVHTFAFHGQPVIFLRTPLHENLDFQMVIMLLRNSEEAAHN